jgi:hypothetical protein
MSHDSQWPGMGNRLRGFDIRHDSRLQSRAVSTRVAQDMTGIYQRRDIAIGGKREGRMYRQMLCA